MTSSETTILAALVTCGVLLALAIPEPAASDPPPRIVTVTDGDTLRIDGERIRLVGIDAPERSQTCLDAEHHSYACGRVSEAALRGMIARDANVTCVAQDRDRYGRTVAVCRNRDGDLGARMVAAGHALAYRRYSLAYVDHEAAAKAERLGMHAGTFTMPEQYRRESKR